MTYSWARYHKNGYEISSRGDRRFSAFYARLPNGQTIEKAYQAAKGSGKGRPAIDPNFDYWGTYLGLWRQWAEANPELFAELSVIALHKVLTDMFAKTENNQARALCTLLNEKYGGTMKFYAGIGSRKTPAHILDLMTHVAKYMRGIDWILRSGAAEGADTAFENGAGGLKQIFTADSQIPEEAMDTVAKYHPAPDYLTPYIKRLMARNAMQIFGSDMNTPVSFVICWTPDGADGINKLTTRASGGTGQAIRIAAANNIDVLNLANEDTLQRVISSTNYQL